MEAVTKKPQGSKKRVHSIQWRDNVEGYLFTAPAIIGLFVFILIPIVASIALSFTKWDLVNRGNGISEEVGYLRTAAYPETHKREDTQLGVEFLARL